MARRRFLVTFSHVVAAARWVEQLTRNTKKPHKKHKARVLCYFLTYALQFGAAHTHTQWYSLNVGAARMDGSRAASLCLCHAYIRTEQMEPRPPLLPPPTEKLCCYSWGAHRSFPSQPHNTAEPPLADCHAPSASVKSSAGGSVLGGD